MLSNLINQNSAINIMTIHASKGLEFDYLFVIGLEEGFFPLNDADIEEERRLAYVAITRAKKESFISFVMNRMYRGDWVESLASRFIDELPEKNIKKEEIKEQKEKAKKKGMPFVYNRKWRDPKNLEIPKNVDPVIRFKSKISGNNFFGKFQL